MVVGLLTSVRSQQLFFTEGMAGSGKVPMEAERSYEP